MSVIYGLYGAIRSLVVGSDPVALWPERQVNDCEIDFSVRGVSHELRRANVMDPQRDGRMSAVKAGE